MHAVIPLLTFTHEFWTHESVETDRDHVYLFGDNMAGVGLAGQACIRGLFNAVGVPTIDHRPWGKVFSDDQFEEVMAVIDARLTSAINLGKPIICHANIGRGLARLHISAPRIYSELLVKLHDLADRSFE